MAQHRMGEEGFANHLISCKQSHDPHKPWRDRESCSPTKAKSGGELEFCVDALVLYALMQ